METGLSLEQLFKLDEAIETKQDDDQRVFPCLIDQIRLLTNEIVSMKKSQEKLIQIVEGQKDRINEQNNKIDVLQATVVKLTKENIIPQNDNTSPMVTKEDITSLLNKMEGQDDNMQKVLTSMKEKSAQQFKEIIQEIQNVFEDQDTETQASFFINDATQLSNRSSFTVQSMSSQIYRTRTGAKYHYAGCGYLSRSQYPVTFQEAQMRGLTSCSRCDR